MNEVNELIAMFRREAAELLGEIAAIFAAQRGTSSDREAFVTARRIAHNLKGIAVTVGAQWIVEPCHAIEFELEATAAKGELPSTQRIESWLRAVSEMQGILGDPAATAHLSSAVLARLCTSPNGPALGGTAPSGPHFDAAAQASSPIVPTLTNAGVGMLQLDELVRRAREVKEQQAQLDSHVHAIQASFDEVSGKSDEDRSEAQSRRDFGIVLRQVHQNIGEFGHLLEVLEKSVSQIRMTPSSLVEQTPKTRQDTLAESRPGPGRILVVDDSLIVRTVEEEILGSAGYDVSACADGEEAWELLQRQQFDLVVCDVQMPKLDGFGLTTRIRASAALHHIPVVLVTGQSAPEDVTRGAQVGADGYVAKGDLEQEVLLSAVRRLIR